MSPCSDPLRCIVLWDLKPIVRIMLDALTTAFVPAGKSELWLCFAGMTVLVALLYLLVEARANPDDTGGIAEVSSMHGLKSHARPS